jgi:hypothetical protein
VWRTVAEGNKSHVSRGLYESVRTIFLYMYAGLSGESRVCTRVLVETVAYVRGSQWIHSRMCGDVRQDFLGRSRSIQADASRPYMWSVADL